MAQVAKLPLTKAGREMIRECHSISSIWAPPPDDCCDISEVDWDDLAVEVDKLFNPVKRGQS